MQIKEMFAKKIDREIQGVIIVGQGEDSNVSQELEEYVVTRELQKHFADFYSAYKKGIVGTTPKMGVWITAIIPTRLTRSMSFPKPEDLISPVCAAYFWVVLCIRCRF